MISVLSGTIFSWLKVGMSYWGSLKCRLDGFWAAGASSMARSSSPAASFSSPPRNVLVTLMRMAPMMNGIQNTMPRYTRPIAMPAALDSPNAVNATTTIASTTPTPCGVMEIMANSVATT